jgi:hypothetical protein
MPHVKYRVIQTKHNAYTLQVQNYDFNLKQMIWRDYFSYYDKAEFDKNLERFKADPFFVRVLENGSVEVSE